MKNLHEANLADDKFFIRAILLKVEAPKEFKLENIDAKFVDIYSQHILAVSLSKNLLAEF